MPNKELTVTEGAMPATFEELSSMAKAFVASGMFTDVKAISQAIVKVQAGKELGIPPVYAMQNINLIKGKLCTSANTMALLIKRSGRYNYRITEHTDMVCKIMFKELEGNKWVDVGESQFTIEDAKRAKLVYPDSAWMKYPRAMLFSRAISQGARLYTPDAIGGVYTSEEIKAIDGPVNDEPVTVTEEPQAKEHWCEEHNTDFFKSGNMNSYGHPIEGAINEKGKQVWCHEHVNKSKAEPDVAQAEKDTKELFPPDPQHAREAAVEPAPEPTESASTPVAEESKAEPPTDSPIDMDWLKESLKAVKWNEKTAATWVVSEFKVKGGLLKDVIARLTKEQVAEFSKKIQDLLEVA